MNTSPAGHLRRDPAPKIVVPTTRPTMAGKFTGKQISDFARELLREIQDFPGFGYFTPEDQAPHRDRVCAAMKLPPHQFDVLWIIAWSISLGWVNAWGRFHLLDPTNTYTAWRNPDGSWRSVNTQYAKG